MDHVLPRAAYIHVPFCRHRCGYCNFTLVAGRDDLIGDYLRAIELELSRSVGTAHQNDDGETMMGYAHPTTPREVDTLYFGGGTPTHLSSTQFRELAAIVRQWFLLAGQPTNFGRSKQTAGEENPRQSRGLTGEWTVEANPADLDREKFELLRELGVTRLSLGGQSFRAEKLRLLERDHAGDDIARTIDWAKEADLQVSLDLIFATPGESLSEWESDVAAAIRLGPDHVSAYGLTFEQGTAFWNRKLRGELIEVDEDLQREMYAHAIDRLIATGYEHYEVSNFAKPGCRSRHNQVYWSGDGYYAAGPGAARYVNGVRETNQRSTTGYLKSVLAGESPVAEREELSAEARAREFLVFSLRRMEGITRTDFRTHTQFEIDELVAAPLGKFVALGLLADDGERIKLTREGLFVSDAMWPEML